MKQRLCLEIDAAMMVIFDGVDCSCKIFVMIYFGLENLVFKRNLSDPMEYLMQTEIGVAKVLDAIIASSVLPHFSQNILSFWIKS